MGFDPENNDIDRRIHFEVTGVSLIEGEFAGVDSSDQSEEEQLDFRNNQVLDSMEEGGDTSFAPLIGGGDKESREDKGNDGKSPSIGNDYSINNYSSHF